MALNVTILKNTAQEVIIKTDGTDQTSTIALADLLCYTPMTQINATWSTTSGNNTLTIGGFDQFVESDIDRFANAEVFYKDGDTFISLGFIDQVQNPTTATLKADAPETVTGADAYVKFTTQVIDGTPSVNIVSVIASGWLGSKYTISRGGINVFTCAPENSPAIQFNQMGISDSVNNTDDLVITHDLSNAELYPDSNCQSWIVLRKVSGFKTKIENATYGAYDDPLRVGARTNISGSPDYVGPGEF
jgi:hypothetical protein